MAHFPSTRLLPLAVAGLCAAACSAGHTAPTVPPPAQPSIALSIAASRTSGVAPLLVFLDATATSGLDGDDFLSAHFTWDFGDASAGAWSTTGLPRNQATGFLAAHVYEQPGTYVVTAEVRDRAGRLATPAALTITVGDPAVAFAGTATRCASRAGDFAGAPAGCEVVTTTDLAAQVAWLDGSPGRRLLLRRGETWPGATVALAGSGPGTLGAFGTGDRPRLLLGSAPGQAAGVLVSGSDWRLLDLDLDGSGLPPQNSEGDTAVGVSGADVLGARLSIHDGTSVAWGAGGDRTCLHESEAIRNGYFSAYLDGVDGAIQGSRVDQVRVAVSFLRPTQTRNMVLTHDLIDASRAAPTTGIKWHSRRGVITDNVLTAGTSRISTTASDVECDFSLDVDRDLGVVLIERNLFRQSGDPVKDAYTSTGVELTEDHAVVRNNLFHDMNLAFRGACGAADVHLLHNSVYMTPGTAGLNVGNGDFLGVDLPPVSGWEVRNNLVWSENPGTNGLGLLVRLASTAGITLGTNLYYKPLEARPFGVGSLAAPATHDLAGWQALGLDAGSRVADPRLLSVDPADPGFFQLGAGSPAIGAGQPVGAFEDFRRAARPAAGGQDVGAIGFR